MANNTDIVKEIEEAERDVVYVTRTCHDEIAVATRKDKRVWIECCDKLRKAELTLQRARDALRWIPCEERLPEKSGNYRTTESIQPMGAEGFLYLLNFSYFDKTTKQWKGRGKIVAWMEHPSPYTPRRQKGETGTAMHLRGAN